MNNVGIFEPKPFEKITDEDWLGTFQANVMSGVRLSRHYLAGMRERNWGRILFISSESAVQIPVEMVHYGVTKTAQVALARGIAEGVAGTGITVNSVLAGPTRSEGVQTFLTKLSAQSGMDTGGFREAILRVDASKLAVEEICEYGRSRKHGRLPGQPAGVGHDWRRSESGWRRGARNPLGPLRLS